MASQFPNLIMVIVLSTMVLVLSTMHICRLQFSSPPDKIYQLFLNSISSRQDIPTLSQLYKLQTRPTLYIMKQIAGSYHTFGANLLGNSQVKEMEQTYNHHSFMITYNILDHWLQEKGKTPVTWETFITELDQIGMKDLARKIESSVSLRQIFGVLCVTVL